MIHMSLDWKKANSGSLRQRTANNNSNVSRYAKRVGKDQWTANNRSENQRAAKKNSANWKMANSVASW